MGHSLTSTPLVGRRLCLHRKPPATGVRRSARTDSVTHTLRHGPSANGVRRVRPRNRQPGKRSECTQPPRRTARASLQDWGPGCGGSRAGLMIRGGSQGNPHASPRIPSSLCAHRSRSTDSAGISFVKLRVKRKQLLNSHLYIQFQR